MNIETLALFGGTPVTSDAWPAPNTIGDEEKRAVLDVLDSGVLSGFRADPTNGFLGGECVRRLESAWSAYCGTQYAISFNSLTSGLQAAIGALRIAPGDEVIVPPYTMSASATCAIFYGGVPVFADIDPASYCLDPASIESRITRRTRAIVVVHLFGYPADMDAIMEIAERHGLRVIEDAAQAPAGRYKGRPVGTIGQIGGFSLNYHKTIHCGEGGVMVTDDADLARRLQLIRNHGEVSVEGLGVDDLENTFGGNYRMTEIEAAIATVQLSKLERLTVARIDLAAYLDEHLSGLPGIAPQRLGHPASRHVYYFYAMRYDEAAVGLPRDLFVKAIRAEGIDLRQGYVRPIYWEPMYRKMTTFAGRRFSNSSSGEASPVSYERGLCPVAEAAHERDLIFGKFCYWPLTTDHVAGVVRAFHKVLDHRDELRARQNEWNPVAPSSS